MIEDFALAEERTEALIQKLINEKEFVEFLIGRDRDYDQIAASCVRRVRRELQAENCALIWVMAYDRAEYRRDQEAFQEYYNGVEVCPLSAQAHPKAAITLRNRWMIDQSDLCVCFAERPGGALRALRYAEKQGKEAVNLREAAVTAASRKDRNGLRIKSSNMPAAPAAFSGRQPGRVRR